MNPELNTTDCPTSSQPRDDFFDDLMTDIERAEGVTANLGGALTDLMEHLGID